MWELSSVVVFKIVGLVLLCDVVKACDWFEILVCDLILGASVLDKSDILLLCFEGDGRYRSIWKDYPCPDGGPVNSERVSVLGNCIFRH